MPPVEETPTDFTPDQMAELERVQSFNQDPDFASFNARDTSAKSMARVAKLLEPVGTLADIITKNAKSEFLEGITSEVKKDLETAVSKLTTEMDAWKDDTEESLGDRVREIQEFIQTVDRAFAEQSMQKYGEQDGKIKEIYDLCQETKRRADALVGEIDRRTAEIAVTAINLIEGLEGDARLDYAALRNAPQIPVVSAISVRSLLETLEDDDRLDASAIKNFPQSVEKIVERTIPVSPVRDLNRLQDVSITNPTDGQVLKYNAATGKWENGTDGGGGGGGGASLELSVSQTGHGFVVGNVIRSNATNNQYAKAQADSASNAEVVGIVTAVENANTFTFTFGGIIEVAAAVPASTAGDVLFLSPTTAGALTTTNPTTIGQISKPLAIVFEGGNKMLWFNWRGMELSSTGGGGGAVDSVNGQTGVVVLTTTNIAEGTAQYFTDERAQDAVGNNVGTGLSYNDASGAISASENTRRHTRVFTLDGQGGTLTTGVVNALLELPNNLTFVGWRVTAKESGSLVIDVQKTTYADFPASFSSIAGTEKPTLSSAQKNEDTSLSTWTTAGSQGEMVRLNIESVTGITFAQVFLDYVTT